MIVYPHGCSRNQIYNASYHNMMRARYGTGVFLNLEKRICNINIELTPDTAGLGYLQIDFQIFEDHYAMYPCSTVSRQFSLFLHLLFCLYSEEYEDHHYHYHRFYYNDQLKYSRDKNGEENSISTNIGFDEEGHVTEITLKRIFKNSSFYREPCTPDPMVITIESPRAKSATYNIDGKDLCYAVAKACTNAIKRYGIFGYGVGTACLHSSDRDDFNLNELLFIKAYALNALEVRTLHYELSPEENPEEKPSAYNSTVSSNFNKELELLLFDM